MSWRWSKRLAAGAVIALVLVAAYFLAAKSGRPRVRLADGSELVFLTVTDATNECFPGGLTDKLIYRFTQGKAVKLGPLRLGPVTPLSDVWRQANGSVAFSNQIKVWIGQAGNSNGMFSRWQPGRKWTDFRATIMAEDGEEWETRQGIQREWPVSARGLDLVSAWSFSSFPRREKQLRFRLYRHSRSNQWDRLVDFPFTNPKPGPHPVWTPMELPASQSINNLEVLLTNLFNGKKQLPYGVGEANFTRAEFLIKENGQVSTAWQPDQLKATDATGNEVWVGMAACDGATTPAYYEIQNNHLSPSEVWRLQVRFSKLRDLPDTNGWASPPLEVQNRRLVEERILTNWGDYRLELNTSQNPFPNTIRFKLTPPPTNARVGNIEVIDDKGRAAGYASGGFGDSEFDVQWTIPEGAEWLKLSLRLVETRTVEFLARPGTGASVQSGP